MRFVACLLFLAVGTIRSWAALPQQNPVYIYSGEAKTEYLGRSLQLLEDAGGMLAIGQVAASTQFKAAGADIPAPGLSRSAFWARLTVLNQSDQARLMLYIAHTEIDELDVYQAMPGSTPALLAHAGLERAIDRSEQHTPELAFLVPAPPGGSFTLYIRVKSSKQLRLPMVLETPSLFAKEQTSRELFIGAYIGILAVMALYNLFVFASIRDRSYLIYFIYLALVCLTQLAFMGFASYYIWPGWGWLASHSTLYLTVLTAIAAGEFMISFLQMREYDPRMIKVFRVCYGMLSLGLALDLAGKPLAGYQAIQSMAALFALVQLTATVMIALRGSRPARYFLAAWCVFLSGIVVFVLKDWGLLPYNDLTHYSMTFGSAVEVVLLSFGLADKINILRKEKERSQAEALRMARENEQMVLEQNTVLERKVNERTRELQESTDHLKRTQSQLVNAEKMASLGQLTAGIAHEINNPVNFISSNIPPLKRDLQDLKQVLDAYREARTTGLGLEAVAELEERIGVDLTVQEVEQILKSMESGAARTSEIVRGLRSFSRLDEDDLKLADVNEGIRSTLVVLGPQLKHAVKVDLDLQALPQVECYPGKLNQVVMNILNNAAFAAHKRHVQGGGVVSIITRTDGATAFIQIRDNGSGMDEAVKQRLFEPFFTTKDVGEGTGLGLSIAMSIMESHHGGIQVESTPEEGSTFTLTLPLVQPRAQRA
jgi:two-component system NtrC family sensor kinase